MRRTFRAASPLAGRFAVRTPAVCRHAAIGPQAARGCRVYRFACLTCAAPATVVRSGRATGPVHRSPNSHWAPSRQPPSAHLRAAYCLPGRPPGRVKPPIFRFVREHGGVGAASYSREGGLRSCRQPGYRPTHLFSMYPAGKPGAGFRQSPHRRCPHSGCRLPLLLQAVCLLRRGRPGRPVRLPVMRLRC